MKITTTQNHTTIKIVDGDILEFIENIALQYKQLTDQNIIVDLLSHKKLSNAQIMTFLMLAKKHKKLKKSFVLVTSDADFNEITDKLTVVPTIQEACDMIEMEEIERDLGF